MPRVKQAAFCCPQCGAATRVEQTRAATATRLHRYRVCKADKSHRFRTREILISEPAEREHSIGNTAVTIAIRTLAETLGIVIDSPSSPDHRKDN